MKIELDDDITFRFERGNILAKSTLFQKKHALHNPEMANFDGVIQGGLVVLNSLLEDGFELPEPYLRAALQALITCAAEETVDESDE